MNELVNEIVLHDVKFTLRNNCDGILYYFNFEEDCMLIVKNGIIISEVESIVKDDGVHSFISISV